MFWEFGSIRLIPNWCSRVLQGTPGIYIYIYIYIGYSRTPFGSFGVSLGPLWPSFGPPLAVEGHLFGPFGAHWAAIGLPWARPWPGRDLSAFGKGSKLPSTVNNSPNQIFATLLRIPRIPRKFWQQVLFRPSFYTRRGSG